jgi:PAS domain S-box-containing protein
MGIRSCTGDFDFNVRIAMDNTRNRHREEISVLKRQIAELRSSNASLESEADRYRGLFENAVEGMFRIDPDGRLLYVNPAGATMMGYGSPEEFMSSIRSIADIYPFLEERENAIAMLRRDGFLRNHEIRNVRKNGEIIWVSANVRMVYDENGQVLYHEGTTRDITYRKKIEQELLESKKLTRTLLDLPLNNTIVLIGVDGTVLDCNDAMHSRLGKSMSEVIGKSLFDLLPPDAVKIRKEKIREIIRTKKPIHMEDVVGGLWYDSTAYPIEDEHGNITKIAAFSYDITEYKKMEEELIMHRDHLGKLVAERTEVMNQEVIRRKEKEDEHLALVESVVEWVWETDEHFVHTYVSPRISEYLGHQPEDFLGKAPYDFMPPDGVPALKKFVSSRKPFTSLQIPALHKNGQTILIEASGKPYFDRDGALKGYRGCCRDITEQKRTMDILKENEKQLMAQSETLKETNAALRVLLKQREDDKREMEDMFMSNIKEMVLPYVYKMQKEKMEIRHRAYLDVITSNLNEIMAPFLNRIRQLNFTPKEIEVASLIKDGKTTKEIAEVMSVATSAIDSHRNNIRTKLGLVNKDVNLRSYLMTFK